MPLRTVWGDETPVLTCTLRCPPAAHFGKIEVCYMHAICCTQCNIIAEFLLRSSMQTLSTTQDEAHTDEGMQQMWISLHLTPCRCCRWPDSDRKLSPCEHMCRKGYEALAQGSRALLAHPPTLLAASPPADQAGGPSHEGAFQVETSPVHVIMDGGALHGVGTTALPAPQPTVLAAAAPTNCGF